MLFEKWNDALEQVSLAPHAVSHPIAVIGSNNTTTEILLQRVQNLHITLVLYDGELRKNLIAALHVSVLVDPNMKAALTIHKTCYPLPVKSHRLAPNVKSLRVPGTDRVFPADCPHARWIFTAGNADEYQTVFEEFPAYGSVLLRLRMLTLGPL